MLMNIRLNWERLELKILGLPFTMKKMNPNKEANCVIRQNSKILSLPLQYNNMELPWHQSICRTAQGHMQYGIDVAFFKVTEFWAWYNHSSWKYDLWCRNCKPEEPCAFIILRLICQLEKKRKGKFDNGHTLIKCMHAFNFEEEPEIQDIWT